MKTVLSAALCLMCMPLAAQDASRPALCTYEVYNWNIHQKRAVNMKKVAHPYAELKAEEKDPETGCTVCMEDQELLTIGKLEPFYVCRKVSGKVRSALEKLIAEGEPVQEVTAYRPGRTKNPLDKNGNRTGFSNHAYGAAVDINRSKNGLYDKCFKFGPSCRLIQGGRRDPRQQGTLLKDGKIVKTMEEVGFKWGGEIEGQQKDFMHFSFTGY